ncbi:hypothetical protein KQX54_014817 [Cotesia glomerata]|uniref:Uncharacterized protein n=1 Tax=Cotesia glomerata TaxID=32391 RepID=A0AAV7J813_COTGL|nr:hypothetical protein KQX54_014817 [Cotesia glomerata]
MGCRTSLIVHMLHAHLDKFKNSMGAYSEEQGERPNNENNRSTASSRMTNSDGTSIVTSSVPFYTPPFPSIIPLPIVPIPPLHLNTLNEEELHEMEGNLRQAVEARIQTLQRIQLLLDAANVMMNQYQNATATSNILEMTSNG